MSSEAVVNVSSLSKCYHIYDKPRDRLMQMLAQGRRKYFREFWALKEVSFQITKTETVAIVGRNGSGKSTLLQIICGTLNPTAGDVQTTGRVAALLELGAGFNPEFTGRENVYMAASLYGLSRQEIDNRFARIAAFADIGDFIEQPVKTYSSGMFVRLAFAVIAHVDSDILVVDEALSVGDVRFTQKCMRFLREFQKTGTLLFVSHDTGAVTGLCSRAIWLDQGTIRMDASAKQTVEAYLAEQHALDRGSLGATVRTPVSQSTDKLIGDIGIVQGPDAVPLQRTSVDAQLQSSGARMEVFAFDPDADASEYGAQEARIERVALFDDQGLPMQVVEGGEIVNLIICARLSGALDNLIFGFYLKDRLGQQLFGDNSYVAYRGREVSGRAGEQLKGIFRFRMPTLPIGAYSFDVAIASGTQDDHTQQHWIHDALIIRAVDSTMRHGLVGIPMLDITISKEG